MSLQRLLRSGRGRCLSCLLLSHLMTPLCTSSQSTPGGCSGHRKVCVAEAPRGRREAITRKQGSVCRWVAPLWLTQQPSAPAVRTSHPPLRLRTACGETSRRYRHSPATPPARPRPQPCLDFPSSHLDEALQSLGTATQARLGTEVLGSGQEIMPRGPHPVGTERALWTLPSPSNLREGLRSTPSGGTRAQESAQLHPQQEALVSP